VIDLQTTLTALADDRPIFHSEADFQHAFAWQIRAVVPDAKVRLEYRSQLKETVYLDVSVQTPTVNIALELKYPTRKLACVVAGEEFALKDQAAQDMRRYDFIKDIVRLEHVVDAVPNTRGYALLLTNDSSYWTTSLSEATTDTAFRIHEGARLAGTLAWASHTGAGTMHSREQNLALVGTYPLEWHDYSVIPGVTSYSRFRYLLVPVEPRVQGAQGDSNAG